MVIESGAALRLMNKYFKNIDIIKTRKKELDVDFIGGTAPLTNDEEKRISEVIKMLKSKKSQTLKPARKLKSEKKITA